MEGGPGPTEKDEESPYTGDTTTSGTSVGAAAEHGREDRTVTALCFHQLNRDILAVGYGAFFFSPSVLKGGAVLFWSVRA